MSQESPASRLQTGASCQISSSIRLEIKCTINEMCLNHSETIPSLQFMEKLFSTIPVPGAKKVEDH